MDAADWAKKLKIDHAQKIPMYYQIAQNITGLYQDGTLKAGMLLPSEWDLAEFYQVSRLTVRQALKELEGTGLIKRRPGVGTFISAPTSTNIYISRLGFSQKIRNLGKTPSSQIISLKTVPGSAEVCQKLQVPETSPVIELVRVRFADDDPIMVETAYLPADLFPGLDEAALASGSLYDLLSRQYGVGIASVEQELHPVLLNKQQARLLDSESGLPAMHSEVVAFAKDQRPVEFSISIIHGEKCKFYFRFREEGNG
jgi:GntR family transcriptional regulator